MCKNMNTISQQATINSAIKILESLYWLVDSYVSDYFVKAHYKNINPAWWEVLIKLEPKELASLLSLDTWNSKCVWPLSLLAYRASVHSLSLDRQQKPISRITSFTTGELHSNHKCILTECSEAIIESANNNKGVQDGQYLDLEHCFRRHVKPKKQHEIVHLSQAIEQLCQECKSKHVIDVGAGQGHLSRLLAFKYGLHATTIEAVGCHSPKAEKLDNQVKHDIQKGRLHSRKNKAGKRLYGTQSDIPVVQCSPYHVTATITPDISVDNFLKQVTDCILNLETLKSKSAMNDHVYDELFNCTSYSMKSDHTTVMSEQESELCTDKSIKYENSRDGFIKGTDKSLSEDSTKSIFSGHTDIKFHVNKDEVSDNSKKISDFTAEISGRKKVCFTMTGLHACGDLTATMLKMFVQCRQLRGLASVGCCYMKITTQPSSSQIGYPMSDYVKSLSNHKLSYEALEMACHFVDAYHQRLLENGCNLQCHCYRAALQEIIADKDPNFNHGCVKVTIKNAQDMDFQHYAEKSLRKLGLDPSLTPFQIRRAEERLKQWKDVVAFYTLRLSVAPVVETIILLDRALYLQENGIHCQLVPIFDPLVSPRNMLLLAKKDDV